MEVVKWLLTIEEALDAALGRQAAEEGVAGDAEPVQHIDEFLSAGFVELRG